MFVTYVRPETDVVEVKAETLMDMGFESGIDGGELGLDEAED